MKKIDIKLENCFGINKLDVNFNLQNSKLLIYAPNGVMKTSFANTFWYIQKDQKDEIKDLHFPEKETKVDIKIDNKEIQSKDIFVIKSYDESFYSENMSLLLVKEELRKQYQEHYKNIEKVKNELYKKIKELAKLGRNDNIDNLIEQIFISKIESLILNDKFINSLDNLEKDLSFIPYKLIFNDKVLKILNSIIDDLNEYISKYNELTTNSPILTKNFTINNIESVKNNLAKDNFFKAGHKLNLKEKGEIENEDMLEEIIKKEKEKILQNPALQEKFDKIAKKFSNKETKDFRDFLIDNQEIIPFLNDLKVLEQQIWLSYLKQNKDKLIEFKNIYTEAQKQIEEIINKAKDTKTEWEEIIDYFNEKFFHLPFSLEIENKEDVLLKQEAPSLKFIFRDIRGQITNYKDRKDLITKLSTWEKRAFYILDIIFEIKAREKKNIETLIIADDIVDSFDYKNKYAIIELLKDISENDKFYLVILTHNFDFFRTIQSRLSIPHKQSFIANKTTDKIELINIERLNILKPFIGWKKKELTNERFIALIPFVRNLIEYSNGEEDNDYLTLTYTLHIKEESKTLQVKEISNILCENIKNLKISESIKNKEDNIIKFILNTADVILNDNSEVKLENKIVLSIASRLLAEKIMINKIDDKDFLDDLRDKKNQTWNLVKKYSELFDNEEKNIKLFKRVLLMTSENIHINSFMYEPILDMSIIELKDLYQRLKNLLK